MECWSLQPCYITSHSSDAVSLRSMMLAGLSTFSRVSMSALSETSQQPSSSVPKGHCLSGSGSEVLSDFCPVWNLEIRAAWSATILPCSLS